MIGVFPPSHIVTNPFIIEPDAAVAGTGSVSSHFTVGSRTAVTRDPLNVA